MGVISQMVFAKEQDLGASLIAVCGISGAHASNHALVSVSPERCYLEIRNKCNCRLACSPTRSNQSKLSSETSVSTRVAR